MSPIVCHPFMHWPSFGDIMQMSRCKFRFVFMYSNCKLIVACKVYFSLNTLLTIAILLLNIFSHIFIQLAYNEIYRTDIRDCVWWR